MTKIKDWDIQGSGNSSTVYSSENGREFLVRNNGRDLAELKQAGENILIKVGSTMILIDENARTISIQS
jgi:hypothetical protein